MADILSDDEATLRKQLATFRTVAAERAYDAGKVKLAEEDLHEFVKQGWHVVEPATPFIDGWHLEAICDHLQACYDGYIRNLLINVPPRVAKPVWVEEPVLERVRGRIKLGDIRVGDEVLTHRGRFRRVLAVHDQGELPLVAVATYCGRAVRTAPDHPFLTPRGWIQAGALTDSDVVASVHPQEACGTAAVTPEEARLLGYLVGDGSCKYEQTGVVNLDPAIIEDVIVCAASLGFKTRRTAKTGCRSTFVVIKPCDGRWKPADGPHSVKQWMNHHQLYGKSSYTKRVPPAIMAATPELIGQFLGAYWSCDGHIEKRGRTRSGIRTDCHIGADTVSHDLALDIQHLLTRLGIQSRLRRKQAKLISKRQGASYVSWVVGIGSIDHGSKFAQVVPLLHAKNKELLPYRRTGFDRVLNEDRVISVTNAGAGQCRCLTVEEDASFTAGDLAVHNSLCSSVFFPAWIWAKKPDRRFLFSSYSGALSIRDSIKCRRLIQSPWYQRNWGHLFKLTGDQNAKEKYETDKTGHRIATSVGGIGVGEGGDFLICLPAWVPITTSHGRIPIGRIVAERLNVRVLAFDHAANATRWQPIEAYESSAGRDSVRVTLSTGEILEATTDHPVFVDGFGYRQASRLRPGDRVVRETALAEVTVVSVEPIATPDRVFNIRIAVDHNYFANGVLLHNCDDGNHTQEVESDVMRQSVIDWWDHTMSTRGNDPKTAVRIIIQQRLHQQDLSGHVLEQGGYVHLNLPMRFEPDRKCQTVVGWEDPRLTEGDLLWPARFGDAEVKELELRLGSYAAAGQLQQRPAPAGGGMLKAHWWRYWQPKGANLRPVPVKLPDGTLEHVPPVTLPDRFDLTLQSWDCLDDQTELLTKDGWRGRGQVRVGDMVFSMNQTTDAMELVPVMEYGERPMRPDERFVTIKSGVINVRVTEGHNLLVELVGADSAKTLTRTILTAGQLVRRNRTYRLPLSAEYDYPGVLLTDDELRLVAWFMTDGGFTNRYFQITQAKEYKHEIRALLKRLGLDFCERILTTSRGTFPNGKPATQFLIPKGTKTGKYLRSGWERYALWLDKDLAPQLMSMTKAQFEIFWSELMKGDGDRSNGYLCTARQPVAERLQQMAVTRGYSSALHSRPSPTGRQIWYVSAREKGWIKSNPTIPAASRLSFESPVEPEVVWCVQNMNGTLVTRRHGKVAIVGNCAFKDKTGNDFVCGMVAAAYGADRFVLDLENANLDLPGTVLAVRRLSARWPNALLKLVEDKANGPAVVQSLRHEIGGFVEVNPQGGKISRAAAAAPMIESGNWYLPHPQLAPWVDELITQCAAFPNAAHDDIVDALSMAALRMMKIVSKPRAKQESQGSRIYGDSSRAWMT